MSTEINPKCISNVDIIYLFSAGELKINITVNSKFKKKPRILNCMRAHTSKPLPLPTFKPGIYFELKISVPAL